MTNNGCLRSDESKTILYHKSNTERHLTTSFLLLLYNAGLPLSELNQLLPSLELSTLGCSSTHNNTLQGLQRTTEPCISKGQPWYNVLDQLK